MADSIRKQFLDALKTRAATLHPCTFAIPTYVPEELPVITIWDDTDEGDRGQEFGVQNNETIVQFEAHEELTDPDDVSAVYEQGQTLLAELIKAVTAGDTTLGDLVEDLWYTSAAIQYPADGESQISAGISIRVRWTHKPGDPYTVGA